MHSTSFITAQLIQLPSELLLLFVLGAVMCAALWGLLVNCGCPFIVAMSSRMPAMHGLMCWCSNGCSNNSE